MTSWCSWGAQVARAVDGQLGRLGGQRMLPWGSGDEGTGKLAEHFEAWSGLQGGPVGQELAQSTQPEAAEEELSDGWVHVSKLI
jgi:hypothetical protein